MFFSGDGQVRTIDFDVTLHAVPQVVFGDTKEGFFALRLRDELSELTGTGKMTNAAGQTGMALIWGHRSPWVDYSGTLDGRAVGIAIFDHPPTPPIPPGGTPATTASSRPIRLENATSPATKPRTGA
jgi:hypothetical protein